MKMILYNIGKTDTVFVRQGIEEYHKRIRNFIDFSIVDLPVVKHTKSTSPADLITKEAGIILNAVSDSDIVVLLDEMGKEYTTREFSGWLEKLMNRSIKKIAFVSGGAYGFSENVYKASKYQLSLSKMTFTHQMVRLFFTEQLYRALTIIRGIPYHND